MKIITPCHSSHLETKNDSLANIAYDEIQTDTDFDVPEDPHHPDDLTLRWRFQILKGDARIYILEHYTTYEVGATQSAELPGEEELSSLLKTAYDLFKATVQERCSVLPELVKVEDFNAVDVFEHSQQIKVRLLNISEPGKNNF